MAKKQTEKDAVVSEDVLKELLAREPFSYDVNADGLYRKYRDEYEKEGRRAMADTVGKASALTGGYGNSYATVAGQQAYGDRLSRADDKIPELYRLAEERYRAEGDALREKYETLAAREKEAEEKNRQRILDEENARRADEELELKRSDRALAETKAADQRKANEDKAAYNSATVAAKRENDYYDYLVGMAKLAGKTEPFGSVDYAKFGIKGVSDLDSLVSHVRAEAKKKGSAAGANGYVTSWLDGNVSSGRLTQAEADVLWLCMKFDRGDFPGARNLVRDEVM